MNVDDMLARSIAYTQAGLRDYGYVTNKDLECREIVGATATARAYFQDRTYVGAVYDGRGDLIRSTLRFNDRDIIPVDPQKLDDIARLSATQAEEAFAVHGGILFPILGHFFLESLARLWPLLWDHGRPSRPPLVYFHHWPGLDLHAVLANPLYRQSLEALGLDIDRVRLVTAPIRFDRLLLADPASIYHRFLDGRMIDVFDRVGSHILSNGRPNAPVARRLYLSRSAWIENRRLLNEEAVDELMAKRGFDIVHTQALEPADLMNRLMNAEVVVAADGSHAHLAAFCRPGIRTIMLDTRPVPSQFAIAVLRRFNAFHIPLFDTPLYRLEHGIVDLESLGALIDEAL